MLIQVKNTDSESEATLLVDTLCSLNKIEILLPTTIKTLFCFCRLQTKFFVAQLTISI